MRNKSIQENKGYTQNTKFGSGALSDKMLLLNGNVEKLRIDA